MDKVDPAVAGLVLLAALMHASWNAVIKSDPDRLASFGLVMMAGCLFGVVAAPFVPLPAPEAWPYLIASVIIHVFYYVFLLRAYAHGDLSLVYPIARGLGPTLVALISGAVVGEYLEFREAVGVAPSAAACPISPSGARSHSPCAPVSRSRPTPSSTGWVPAPRATRSPTSSGSTCSRARGCSCSPPGSAAR